MADRNDQQLAWLGLGKYACLPVAGSDGHATDVDLRAAWVEAWSRTSLRRGDFLVEKHLVQRLYIVLFWFPR